MSEIYPTEREKAFAEAGLSHVINSKLGKMLHPEIDLETEKGLSTFRWGIESSSPEGGEIVLEIDIPTETARKLSDAAKIPVSTTIKI